MYSCWFFPISMVISTRSAKIKAILAEAEGSKYGFPALRGTGGLLGSEIDAVTGAEAPKLCISSTEELLESVLGARVCKKLEIS